MDHLRLDGLARSLGHAPNRRAAMRALLGGVLAGLGVTGAEAQQAAGCFIPGRRCRKDRQCCSRKCLGGWCTRYRNRQRRRGCPAARWCAPSNKCCRAGMVCAPGGGVCCLRQNVCEVGGVPAACCSGTCCGVPAVCCAGTCSGGVCVPP